MLDLIPEVTAAALTFAIREEAVAEEERFDTVDLEDEVVMLPSLTGKRLVAIIPSLIIIVRDEEDDEDGGVWVWITTRDGNDVWMNKRAIMYDPVITKGTPYANIIKGVMDGAVKAFLINWYR